MNDVDEYVLNTSKFAKLCGVSTGIIWYCSRKNMINFIYTKGGQRRYRKSEVIIFLNKRKNINIEYTKVDLKKVKSTSSEYGRIWRSINKDKCRQYARNRYNKNLEFASIKWMRNFSYRTEKRGFSKTHMNTIMEFGYTPKQLIMRIECQFKEGMSWSNRSEWHIDHKKPISKFKEGTSPRIINMLCSLQPIWKIDNLSKKNNF